MIGKLIRLFALEQLWDAFPPAAARLAFRCVDAVGDHGLDELVDRGAALAMVRLRPGGARAPLVTKGWRSL